MLVVVIAVAVGACGYRPPYRYTNNLEVERSAQRASVSGLLTYACLWRAGGIAGAGVELFADGREAPIAVATTGHDGGFLLSTDYLEEPESGGFVRIRHGDQSEESRLPGRIDENYEVRWEVACPEDRPEWIAADGDTLAAAPAAGSTIGSGHSLAEERRITWRLGRMPTSTYDDRIRYQQINPVFP